MAQLNFHVNFAANLQAVFPINNGTITFNPITPSDSVSLGTLNFLMRHTSAANKTITLSIGLYSLNGSTLSITNSLSMSTTFTNTASTGWISLTAISATQNITPGTWWLALLASTAGANAFSFLAASNINVGNAFPGAFIGGAMTDSTNALPASYATSDLDITGLGVLSVPLLILSA